MTQSLRYSLSGYENDGKHSSLSLRVEQFLMAAEQ